MKTSFGFVFLLVGNSVYFSDQIKKDYKQKLEIFGNISGLSGDILSSDVGKVIRYEEIWSQSPELVFVKYFN